MKQIYYVIQALIHGCGANIIKVVSLGKGGETMRVKVRSV